MIFHQKVPHCIIKTRTKIQVILIICHFISHVALDFHMKLYKLREGK